MTRRHSLCETRARILHTQSCSLDMSLAWDRCSKVRSPYMGSDEICFLTFALLGKLKTFSPWNRLGDVASFGSGQIQPLPIFLLATGAQQMLLQMLHSHPSIRIRYSIASLRYRLLSFCYVTSDTESRNQWQCSARHEGTTRAHPDNWKMKVKKISALCVETSTLHASILCLRQRPYHSKIPRAGAGNCPLHCSYHCPPVFTGWRAGYGLQQCIFEP